MLVLGLCTEYCLYLGEGLRHAGPQLVAGGHSRGREGVARAGVALARGRRRRDRLRRLGFVDLGRLGRGGGARAAQLSTVYIRPQGSS